MLRATRLCLPILLTLALVACSGGDDSSSNPEPTPTHAPTPAAFIETFIDAPYSEGTTEGIAPFYHEPQPTAAFLEPSGDLDVKRMPAATIATGSGTGWEAGGVQIRPLDGELTPEEANCAPDSVVQVQMLYFTYLPPDTEIDGPPYQMLCEDRTVLFGAQGFDRAEGFIQVRYELDAPVFRGFDLATNIEQVAFAGTTGLLIDNPDPADPNSSARALIGIPHGYIFVQGGGLSAEEVLRILAGIECPDC